MNVTWNKVEECLPAFNISVLATDGDYKYMAIRKRTEKHWYWQLVEVDAKDPSLDWGWDFYDYKNSEKITHWMPLPMPPGRIDMRQIYA